MAVQTFIVTGLTPDNEQAAEDALNSLPGVLYALVDHRHACAEVEFEDDAVTTEAMRRAVEGIGVVMRIAG
jgi:hypothetical protein